MNPWIVLLIVAAIACYCAKKRHEALDIADDALDSVETMCELRSYVKFKNPRADVDAGVEKLLANYPDLALNMRNRIIREAFAGSDEDVDAVVATVVDLVAKNLRFGAIYDAVIGEYPDLSSHQASTIIMLFSGEGGEGVALAYGGAVDDAAGAVSTSSLELTPIEVADEAGSVNESDFIFERF